MRLTQYTDYSLRVLIYLAMKGEELTPIRAITHAYGISHNHLTKVVQQLAHEGYVQSIRGQGGGLRLGKPAEEIGVGDVVRKMEPDFAVVECLRPSGYCTIASACVLTGILEDATRAFLAELDKFTLADLLPNHAKPQLVKLLGIDAG